MMRPGRCLRASARRGVRRGARRRGRAALAAAFALCAFVVAACGHGSEDDEADTATTLVRVHTVEAVAQPFTETVGAMGSVAARPGHVAALGAPAPARITRVLVTPGARVREGQPLIELERATFHAKAQSAQVAVDAAQRAFDRTDRLVREGIAPRKDAEQAATTLAQARAVLVEARRDEELATLRSPIAGVVTMVSATLGAMADPAQPLVQVADPSAVDVEIGVTPDAAARIRPGAQATLTAGQSASEGGESLGAGRVLDVGGTVDSATRTVRVRIRATAPRRPLRIGEIVYAEVALSVHANAIVVPMQALVPSGEGFTVFVVDSAGRAEERAVRVGGRTAQMAEIVSGVRAGERVVTSGAYEVEDGARVVPIAGADSTADSAAAARDSAASRADRTSGAGA
ncbi:MAG TPA: efflux RND transporter periplasmic adaptor subunit [Gemmatimonadaceae bacterium]|nr:efflux RND transporter periplasmic adaptor subunit [Gemmatimonadaceae bacterium]